jgi:hypothetical protein
LISLSVIPKLNRKIPLLSTSAKDLKWTAFGMNDESGKPHFLDLPSTIKSSKENWSFSEGLLFDCNRYQRYSAVLDEKHRKQDR